MKFKVEFELKDKNVNEKEIMEYFNWEFGIISALWEDNPFAYACLKSVIKNVTITKLEE
jgi:hypothetical protein